jgi:hypothetical protein
LGKLGCVELAGLGLVVVVDLHVEGRLADLDAWLEVLLRTVHYHKSFFLSRPIFAHLSVAVLASDRATRLFLAHLESSSLLLLLLAGLLRQTPLFVRLPRLLDLVLLLHQLVEELGNFVRVRLQLV